MGIIGNEGGRKEVVILGETVERAFLFMQAAMKIYGKIYVDYETKAEAAQFIDFHFIEHVEFPNKFANQPLFEPLFTPPPGPKKCNNTCPSYNPFSFRIRLPKTVEIAFKPL